MFDIDINYAPVWVGARGEGAGRVEHGWAVAAERGIAGAWKVGAELSGTRRRNATPTLQGLAFLSRPVSRTAVLDVGFARSLAHGPRLTTVFAGMALLLGTVR